MAKKGGAPENLTSYEKGHKSKGGRPKGSVSLTTTLKKLLDDKFVLIHPISKTKEKRSVGHWINIALIGKAMKGNVPAIQHIYDRVDGKLVQALTGDLNLNLSEMSTKDLEDLAGR